ncbi:MAG TPA: zinc ABC transporter substrate-binding protein, partial [Ruminococcaceae bacterium]|nr:zinc ABC transporter substrate-binding protein [Oscillospiraceae bacterium]
MNRRISLLTAILYIAFVFSACSIPRYNDDTKEDKLKIVTTIFPQYDFARQIGKEKISLKMLVTPGGESHSYEPSPQDIIAVKECDIFICAGGESDIWSNVILDSIEAENIKVIKMMECVDIVEEEISNGMTEKLPIANEDETEYDEHVWTSPKNAKKISEAIAKAMISADKENEDFYRSNFDDYSKKLDKLDKDFRNAVSKAANKTVVFGDRFPFRYLFDEYGLNYYAAFPGCSTDSDVSAKTMMFLIRKINENEISSVFYIEFSARKIADTISSETGAEPLLFHSCHTVSRDDFENGITYIDLMCKNLE